MPNPNEIPNNSFAQAEQTVLPNEGLLEPLLQVLATGDLRPDQKYTVREEDKRQIAISLRQNVFTSGVQLNQYFRKVNTILGSIPTPVAEVGAGRIAEELEGYENGYVVAGLVNRALGREDSKLSGDSLTKLVNKYPSPILLESILMAGLSDDEGKAEIHKKSARVLMHTAYGPRYFAAKQLEHLASTAQGYNKSEVL